MLAPLWPPKSNGMMVHTSTGEPAAASSPGSFASPPSRPPVPTPTVMMVRTDGFFCLTIFSADDLGALGHLTGLQVDVDGAQLVCVDHLLVRAGEGGSATAGVAE